MQWHWGNLGSAVGGVAGGLSALAIAVSVLSRGPSGYRTWKERQRADRDLAREQAEDLRLDRRRYLYGWSPGVVAAYRVVRVTDPAEMSLAASELAANGPSDYAVLKVAEGPGNPNRARDLRQLIDREGVIARAPTKGEYEALEAGLKTIAPEPATRAGPPGGQPAAARRWWWRGRSPSPGLR